MTQLLKELQIKQNDQVYKVGNNISNDDEYNIGTSTISSPSVKQVKSDLDNKQDILIPGTTLKTVNGLSLLGNGNISTFVNPVNLCAIYINDRSRFEIIDGSYNSTYEWNSIISTDPNNVYYFGNTEPQIVKYNNINNDVISYITFGPGSSSSNLRTTTFKISIKFLEEEIVEVYNTTLNWSTDGIQTFNIDNKNNIIEYILWEIDCNNYNTAAYGLGVWTIPEGEVNLIATNTEYNTGTSTTKVPSVKQIQETKQNKEDDLLKTSVKGIVPAINELRDMYMESTDLISLPESPTMFPGTYASLQTLQRFDCSTVKINDYLYVLGGITSSNVNGNKLSRIDLIELKEEILSNISYYVCKPSMVHHNGFIYSFAGYTGGTYTLLNTISKYNIGNNSWTNVDSDITPGIYNFVEFNNKFYSITSSIGFAASGHTAGNSIIIFNPETETWEPSINIPETFRFDGRSKCVIKDDDIFMVNPIYNNLSTNKVCKYNITNNEWSMIGDIDEDIDALFSSTLTGNMIFSTFTNISTTPNSLKIILFDTIGNNIKTIVPVAGKGTASTAVTVHNNRWFAIAGRRWDNGAYGAVSYVMDVNLNIRSLVTMYEGDSIYADGRLVIEETGYTIPANEMYVATEKSTVYTSLDEITYGYFRSNPERFPMSILADITQLKQEIELLKNQINIS